jgi:hypothetical protein
VESPPATQQLPTSKLGVSPDICLNLSEDNISCLDCRECTRIVLELTHDWGTNGHDRRRRVVGLRKAWSQLQGGKVAMYSSSFFAYLEEPIYFAAVVLPNPLVLTISILQASLHYYIHHGAILDEDAGLKLERSSLCLR